MKKLIIILSVLLLSCATFCQGKKDSIVFGSLNKFNLQIKTDSTDYFIEIYQNGTIRIGGDTSAVIKMILGKMIKEIDQKNAAEEVLKYVTTDGNISNRKKFNEAVKKYMDIKKQK